MQVGDRVICINDIKPIDGLEEINRIFLIWVKKDAEYVIRDIQHNDNIVIGILLEEIHNYPVFIKLINRVQEPAFADWRFAKIAKQIQTIEIEKEETVKI